MTRLILALPILAACFALVRCSGTNTTQTSIVTSIYATATALDTAEHAAVIYADSPGADPVVVAKLKALDNTAFNAVKEAVANGNNVTADQQIAAQTALLALTSYLIQNGAK